MTSASANVGGLPMASLAERCLDGADQGIVLQKSGKYSAGVCTSASGVLMICVLLVPSPALPSCP